MGYTGPVHVESQEAQGLSNVQCASGSALYISKYDKALEFVLGSAWLDNSLKSGIFSP